MNSTADQYKTKQSDRRFILELSANELMRIRDAIQSKKIEILDDLKRAKSIGIQCNIDTFNNAYIYYYELQKHIEQDCTEFEELK